jgi:hypothetical protein
MNFNIIKISSIEEATQGTKKGEEKNNEEEKQT